MNHPLTVNAGFLTYNIKKTCNISLWQTSLLGRLNMDWKYSVHSLHCYVNIHIFHYRILDYLSKKCLKVIVVRAWQDWDLVCGNHVNVLPPLIYVLLSWNSVRLPESEKDKLTPRRWGCTVSLTP